MYAYAAGESARQIAGRKTDVVRGRLGGVKMVVVAPQAMSWVTRVWEKS